MPAQIKALLGGVVMLIVGVLLWRFGGGVQIPIFSLDKVGVVLMVLGALEIVVTLGYQLFSGSTSKNRT